MKVDFHFSYPLSRLVKLNSIYRQKAVAVEEASSSAPRLTELPRYLIRGVARASREVARLTDALRFCQRLLSYRRGVQDKLVSLSEQLNEVAIGLSNPPDLVEPQKLTLLSSAIEAQKRRLGFYGGSPINLCVVAHTINDWNSKATSNSEPQNLQDGLEKFMSNLTSSGMPLAVKVADASQFLLEKVLARHEEDLQLIESAICRIQSEIKSNRGFLAACTPPRERHVLECSQAKSALERFFSLRIAERQTWKRFEETLFRNS
jgi:hypothetical protein